jgi:hypothetical protein
VWCAEDGKLHKLVRKLLAVKYALFGDSGPIVINKKSLIQDGKDTYRLLVRPRVTCSSGLLYKHWLMGEFAHPNVLAYTIAFVLARQCTQLNIQPGDQCFCGFTWERRWEVRAAWQQLEVALSGRGAVGSAIVVFELLGLHGCSKSS